MWWARNRQILLAVGALSPALGRGYSHILGAAGLPLAAGGDHPWLDRRDPTSASSLLGRDLNGKTLSPDSAYSGLVMVIEFGSDKYGRATSPKIDWPGNTATNVLTVPGCLELDHDTLVKPGHSLQLSPWLVPDPASPRNSDTRRACQMFGISSVPGQTGLFTLKLNNNMPDLGVSTAANAGSKPHVAVGSAEPATGQYQIQCDAVSLNIESQAYLATKCSISPQQSNGAQVWQSNGANQDLVTAAPNDAAGQYFNLLKIDTGGTGITVAQG